MLPTKYWIEMRAADFRAARMADVIAVLPVAAVEQHGPHLPVGVDLAIMQGYLARVVERLPADLRALFLPVQAVGVSTEHGDFPGTLTLTPEAALASWRDIGASVARAGCRQIVIVNSHGGNSALVDILAQELRARHEMLAVRAAWGRFGAPDGLFSAQERTHGIHGGDVETSLMLAFAPELVDMSRAGKFTPASVGFETEFTWLRADRPIGFGWMAQDLSDNGAMGDASAATAAKGEALADYGATAFIELLRDVEAFDLARLG